MGLRIAILLAVIGGLALIGAIAFFAVPNQRGPRAAVLATGAVVLLVAALVVFLAPIAGVTQAPVSPNLSLYLTGQVCESAPPTFNSNCGSGQQALLNLRATDGATRWSAPASVAAGKTNNSFLGAPILRGGVIYAVRGGSSPGDDAATVLALRASDGSEIWRATLDSTPLAMDVADGQVYMLLKYHEDASLLRIFQASDGAPAQQFTLPIFVGFMVTNSLIIGCDTYPSNSGPSNASFIAYHASDGSLAWRESLPDASPVPGAPPAACALIVGDGVLYQAPFTGASVTAVHIDDGQPLWTAQVQSVASLNLIGNQLIAVSTPSPYAAKFQLPNPTSDTITALNLADGHTLWQRELASGQGNEPSTSASAAVDSDRVYVASSSDLRALRLSDGATVWERKSGGDRQFYSYPAVAQGTLFAEYGGLASFGPVAALRSAVPSHIAALNAETGEPYWSVPVYSTGFVLGEI